MMESDVFKSVEEIGGYTPAEMIAMYDDYERMTKECEAYAALGTVEELAALKEAEQKRKQLWHDAINEPPDENGLYYGKKDETNSMYAVQYKDGIWTFDMYPSRKINIIRWAYYGAFEEADHADS